MSVATITENLDLLQHRTGVEPIFAFSDTLCSIKGDDLSQVEVIICIGLSHDDRGILSWYKHHNPQRILVALDLKTPRYLSDHDYLCAGDLQEILPSIAEMVRENV